MEIDDRLAAHIHGILSSDSDSDFDGKIDFDEEYNLLKPPPFNYDSIKDNILLIPANKVVNVWEERLKVMQNHKNKKNEIGSDVITKKKKEESNGLVGRGEFDEEHPLMNPPPFADNSNIANKIINVWDKRLKNLQNDTDMKKQIETTKRKEISEEKATEKNIDLPIVNAEIEEKLLNIKNNEQENKKYLTDFDDQIYLSDGSTLLKSDSIRDERVDNEGEETFKYFQIEGDLEKNYEIVSDATVTNKKKKKKSQKKKAEGQIVDLQLLKEVHYKNEDYAGTSKEPKLLKSSYNSVPLKNIKTVNHETKIVTVQEESSNGNKDEDKKNKTVSDIIPTKKNKKKSKKMKEKENFNLPVINKQNTNKRENEEAHDVIVSNENSKRELRGIIAASIKNNEEIISESKIVNVWEKRQKNLQNNKDEDKKKCAEATHLLERGFWDVEEVCQNNLLQVCQESVNSMKEIMHEKSKVGANYQIIDGKEIVSDVVKTFEKKKKQKKSKKTSQDDKVELLLDAANREEKATEFLERGIWNVDEVCQNNFSQVCKESVNNVKEKMQKKAKDGDDCEMDDQEEIVSDVVVTIENKKESKKTEQDSNVELSLVWGSSFEDISKLICEKIFDIHIDEENREKCVAATNLLEMEFWDVDEGCHKDFSQICKELVNNPIEIKQKKYKDGANNEIDDQDLISDIEAMVEIKLDNNVNLSQVGENGKKYVAVTDLLERGFRDVDEDCQKKISQACKESANNVTEQMQKKSKVTDNYEIDDEEKIVGDVVATIKRKKRGSRFNKTKGDSNVELSLDEEIGEKCVKATEFLKRGHQEVDEVCQGNMTCKENVDSTKDIMQVKSKVTNEYEIDDEKIVDDVVAKIKRKKRQRRSKKTKGNSNVELSLNEEIGEKCVEATELLERGIWNVDKVCQNNFSQVCKESVNNAKEKMQKKGKDGDDNEMDDQEEIVSDVAATIENKKESKETEQDSNVEISHVWGSDFMDISKRNHEKILDIHIDEENREKCVEATQLLERGFREVDEVCQDNFSKVCKENVNSTKDIMQEKSKVTNKYEIDNEEKIDGEIVATIKRKKRRRKSKKTKGDSSVELSPYEEIGEERVEACELLERAFEEVDEVCQDNFSQACKENVNSAKDIMQEKSKVGDNYENDGKDVIATIKRKKNQRKSKKTKQDNNVEVPLANESNFVNIPKLTQTELDEICISEEFKSKCLKAMNLLGKRFCTNETEWQHNFSQIYSETEMKSIFNIDNLTEIIQNKFNGCEVNKVDEQKTIYDSTAINEMKKRWQRNNEPKHAETVELNEQAQSRMLEKSNFDKKLEEKDILNADVDSDIDETFSTNASRARTEPENKSSKLTFSVQISFHKRCHVTDDDLSIRFPRKCAGIPMAVGKQQQQNQMEDKVQVDCIETQMGSEGNKKKKENLKNQKKFTEENLPINTVIKVQPEEANDNEGIGMSVYFQEKSINNYYSQFIDLYNTHENFPVDPVISVPNEYLKNSCRLFKDCKKVISSGFWYGMFYQNFKHINISQHLNPIFIDHYYLTMSYYQFEVYRKILTDYFHGVTKGENTKLQVTVICSITNSKFEPSLMRYVYENIPHQICTYLDKDEPKVSNKRYNNQLVVPESVTNSNTFEFVFNSMLNSTHEGFANCWKFYRNLPQYNSRGLKYPQITIHNDNVTAEIENKYSKMNSRGTNQAVLLPHQLSNDCIFSSETFNKEFPSIDEVYTKKCANKCHLEITNQPTLNTISRNEKKRYSPFLQNSEENSNLTNSKTKTDSGQVFPKTVYKIDKVEETSKEDNAKLNFGNENIVGLDSGINNKTKIRKKAKLKQPITDCDNKYQSVTVQEKDKILKTRDVNKKYVEDLLEKLENEISKKNFNNVNKLCNSKNRKNGSNEKDSNTPFDDFMKFFSESSEILGKCEEISSFICEQVQNRSYDNTPVFIENKEENFKDLVSNFLKVNKFVTYVTTNCKQMCKLIDQEIKTKNFCNDKNGSVEQLSTKKLFSENKELLHRSQHANENLKLTTNNSAHTNGYLNSSSVVGKPTKVLYQNKNDTSFRKTKDKSTVKKFASNATVPRLAVSKAGNIKNINRTVDISKKNNNNLNSINEHINLTNDNISMKLKNSGFDNPVLRIASKKKRNSNNKKKLVADTTILFFSLCLVGLFLTFEMCLLSEARKIHFFDNILIIVLLSLFFICQKYFYFFM